MPGRVLMLLVLLTGLASAQSPFDDLTSGSDLLDAVLRVRSGHGDMVLRAFGTVYRNPDQYRNVMPPSRHSDERGGPPAAETAFQSQRAPIMPALLADALQEQGADRQAIEQVFELCLRAYRDVARQLDLPPDDVAEAVAVCLGNNYYIVTRRDLSKAQLAATSQAVRVALTQTDFASLAAGDKQAMFELMAILSIFPSLGLEIARQDQNPALAQQCQEMARGTFRALVGVEPEQVRFTETGLSITGG